MSISLGIVNLGSNYVLFISPSWFLCWSPSYNRYSKNVGWKYNTCSSYICCVTNCFTTQWLKITILLGSQHLWVGNLGRHWQGWLLSALQCRGPRRGGSQGWEAAHSSGLESRRLVPALGWLLMVRSTGAVDWSALSMSWTPSQHGSLRTSSMLASSCRVEAALLFMAEPWKSHHVTNLPRFKGKGINSISWSQCRGACGTGDIVTAMFGKYKLPWLVCGRD